jgi:uncharacterized protein (TIGR03437 family)
MRGQTGNVQFLAGGHGGRTTSAAEDPARRRDNGGGGIWRLTLQLTPAVRPAINAGLQGPAVSHADGNPVLPEDPAGAGEALSLYCTGLGPTSSGVDPRQRFPEAGQFFMNRPLSVTINGIEAQILYAGGYPGSVDGYQVNFRVPVNAVAGQAVLQISAAWIRSKSVTIAIR